MIETFIFSTIYFSTMYHMRVCLQINILQTVQLFSGDDKRGQLYLSFLSLLPFNDEDLLHHWWLLLATALLLAAFTILTHSLELFPGTEKVDVISTVAQ